MSKLFKDLNYDSDRVMQPGDPLTSQTFGGYNGVVATAVVKTSSTPKTGIQIKYAYNGGDYGVASTALYDSDTSSWRGDSATYTPSGESFSFKITLSLDVTASEAMQGKAKFATLRSFYAKSGSSSTSFLGDNTKWITFPVTSSQKTVVTPSDGNTYSVYEYTATDVELNAWAKAQYGSYFQNSTLKFYVIDYGSYPFPFIVITYGGAVFDDFPCQDVGYKASIVTKYVATSDELPTNSHDADKVISPSGTTIVRSLDNGTATITHPGTSGSLGAPVVTFSDDFSCGTLSSYAGTSVATDGPHTVSDSWTVWVKVGDTVPSDVGGIMSKDFIIAAPSPTLVMIFNEGSDVANVQNIGTQSPTVSVYASGATGSITMVRNYADVTETLATTADIQEALGTVASALDAINGEVL